MYSAKELCHLLATIHPQQNGWLFFPEFRLGTGYGHFSETRVDAWAIHAYPSSKGTKGAKAPNLRRAFEIKVSATDAQSELRNPDKRWRAYAISHEFYFVAPSGLINKKLLDRPDGLIEWDGKVIKIVKPALVRETMPPRWDFVAALARRCLSY